MEFLVIINDSIILKYDKYQSYYNALSTDLPHIIYMMNQNKGKIQKFKILDRKDVPRQGPINDYRVFVVEFIESIILRRPVSNVVQSNMSEYRKGYATLC